MASTPSNESWNNLFVSEDHGAGVLAMMSEQRSSRSDLCDLRLMSADGKVLPCHRAVLASQSVFVDELLKEGDVRPEFGAEVSLPQRGDDLAALLEYIYSGTLDISERNCWRLYSTVCYFRMRDPKVRDEVSTVRELDRELHS